MCLDDIQLAVWPPFGKKLHSWLTVYLFVLCLFGYEDWALVLIAPVPGHCLLFYLTMKIMLTFQNGERNIFTFIACNSSLEDVCCFSNLSLS